MSASSESSSINILLSQKMKKRLLGSRQKNALSDAVCAYLEGIA